jgi:hypothetical protein
MLFVFPAEPTVRLEPEKIRSIGYVVFVPLNLHSGAELCRHKIRLRVERNPVHPLSNISNTRPQRPSADYSHIHSDSFGNTRRGPSILASMLGTNFEGVVLWHHGTGSTKQLKTDYVRLGSKSRKKANI